MQAIYLNHAGTSWPKPRSVADATAAAFEADPIDWPKLFETSHETVAEFFHVEPSRLLLTPSCTAALQLAVRDHPWRTGDRVLTSHFEHHAMHRSLVQLEELGVDVTMLPTSDAELIELDSLEAELKRGGVRLLAITAACNVTGRMLPVADAIDLAHRYDAQVLIDGAQTAGWWDLDVAALGADLFTFAGHKGPQGPWGVGGLYVRPDLPMKCPTAVCDIGDLQARSRAVMPGYCDAGSVNLAALVALAESCRWLSMPAQQDRLERARGLAAAFADSVREMQRVTIHHDAAIESKVPTVAISMAGVTSAELASQLRDRGLVAAGGFQCAPMAHRAIGTVDTGVLRFSFGPSNHDQDVLGAIELLKQLISEFNFAS